MLLDRQTAFEQLVKSHLERIQAYLEDLVVLTPPPFNPQMTMSTPKPAASLLQKNLDDSFSDYEPNGPVVQLTTSNSAPVPTTLQASNSAPVSPVQVILSNDKKDGLEPSKILQLRTNSCSRENFASKLVKELFTVEDRTTSNVKGVMGKKKLNEEKMSYVQAVTFQNYPCVSCEQKIAWSKCVKAIDTANRALCRMVKQKENNIPE